MIKQSRLGQILWPTITDLSSAERASFQGCSAAMLVGIVTGISAVLGWTHSGYLAFVDVVIFGLVAWCIRRNSRVAGVLGLSLYVSSQLFEVATGGSTNPVMFFILTFMFINGVRGTFGFRRVVAARFREPEQQGST